MFIFSFAKIFTFTVTVSSSKGTPEPENMLWKQIYKKKKKGGGGGLPHTLDTFIMFTEKNQPVPTPITRYLYLWTFTQCYV